MQQMLLFMIENKMIQQLLISINETNTSPAAVYVNQIYIDQHLELFINKTKIIQQLEMIINKPKWISVCYIIHLIWINEARLSCLLIISTLFR